MIVPKKTILFFSLFFYVGKLQSQPGPIFENLPVGKYAVGFKIVTITDNTRVSVPEYNYLGEKNEGARHRRITIHVWYPAKSNSSKPKITYGEYGYNHLRSSTHDVLSAEIINRQHGNGQRSIERWFGKPPDEDWNRLLATPMLAQNEASPLKEKFPLLIGMLRVLSTSVVNELLASNGYIVAMVKGEGNGSFAEGALVDIPDMQYAIHHLKEMVGVDENNIGTFGFSGSGFSQVLFSMFDKSLKAVADIESGIYMEGLYQLFSASNYYNPSKLRIPFLHIFSRDLSKQEKFIEDFERKSKFSERYQLILNQPGLHHWDFASEGYTSCVVLKNRGAEQIKIQQSFELASLYLLNFFNAKLKGDVVAQAFLSNKPSLPNIPADRWDIKTYSPVRPAPTVNEFENMIRLKGIQSAMNIASGTLKSDSSTNMWQGFNLNRLGYVFLNEKKYSEAIGVFNLNTELHADEANWFDSLAEAYEASAQKENMKSTSRKLLDLLSKKDTLTSGEKSLQETAERRL